MTSDRRHRYTGIFISVALHLLVLIGFLFLAAWRPPDPPLPQYGIELQFGLDEAGGGGERPPQTAEPDDAEAEVAPPSQEADLLSEQPADVVEELVEDEANSDASPSDTPSVDDRVAVRKKTITPNASPAKKPEPAPKPVPKKRTPDPKATYSRPSSQPDRHAEHGRGQGDDVSEKKNKGRKEGTPDGDALYGNAGGGVGLQLAGWDWDRVPKPRIPDDESAGRIEFEIKVDQNGELIGYRVLERSLSLASERACREALSQLTFTKKKGIAVPAVSTGKITFVVRSR